jgi:hypothetical protein
MNRPRLKLLIGMVLTAAISRLIPHPPNLTPIAAMALFGGATLDDKRAAFLVPLAALIVADLWLGFSVVTPVVYGSFTLIVCIGFSLRGRRSAQRIAAAALAGAVLFFVLSNLGVWALTPLYPKTLSGFSECYVAALPFFRNTVAGDLLYTALLFGGLALAERRWRSLAEPAPAGP